MATRRINPATGEAEDLVMLINGSAQDAAAVVPSDSVDLTAITKAVYIGVGGDLRVTLERGSAPVTFTGLTQGVIYPIAAKRIHLTGTTAGNLLAVY